ncbi:c-type cytochrome [Auritidibacter ignavus]|uniref:Cytochrome bc1 complex cytochrome c subunit n=1 Tax=Auritidibacter ignavus TaxID=678932 RepID=A0AAJ6DCK9_9MICC|nr:c-type cytochrome [Auritidibacter ignavus]WGH84427.1 c-type cytochrome [Auritidibacter ignavus]WGH93750.1 c-type cytochrome [Auritidibacter ignavus]
MKALSQNRRHPAVAVALLLIGLLLTGGLYALASSLNTASATTAQEYSESDVAAGERLFNANCATCHGMDATGTSVAPSLVGVGAASVDFQVGTGRMPMQMHGPQAQQKQPQFNDEQTQQMAAYVASLGAGPAVPEDEYLDVDHDDVDLARGGEIFRVNCAMCHAASAGGGALTRGKFAPTLHGVEEKHIYEAMQTGPQNMPVFSDANISPDQKRDVIAYLKEFENQGHPGGFSLGSLGPVAEGLFIWTAGLGLVIGFMVWLTSRSS